MLNQLDKYTRNARLKPAVVMLLPVGMAVASWVPIDSAILNGLSAIGVTAALSLLLSHLVRGPGKRLEVELYDSWGGMPSVLMLSYAHTKLPRESLSRYHTLLNRLVSGIQLPSDAQDEANNLPMYTTQYRIASDWLLSNTRSQERFGLVFAENVNYGFRRNLLGIKGFGLTFSIIGSLVTGVRTFAPMIKFGLPTSFSLIAAIYFAVSLLMILLWLVVVRPSWVRVTADEFARQLLLASDQLHA